MEGGGELLESCFKAKAIDEVHVFVANKTLGGSGAASPIGGYDQDSMPSTHLLNQLQSRPVEDDIYFWGRPAQTTDLPGKQD